MFDHSLRSIDIPTLVDCGCKTIVWDDKSGVEIEYCPMHKAAPDLVAALKWLDTAIMPEEREYGLYGYCMIHREILREFDGKVKQALAQVKEE